MRRKEKTAKQRESMNNNCTSDNLNPSVSAKKALFWSEKVRSYQLSNIPRFLENKAKILICLGRKFFPEQWSELKSAFEESLAKNRKKRDSQFKKSTLKNKKTKKGKAKLKNTGETEVSSFKAEHKESQGESVPQRRLSTNLASKMSRPVSKIVLGSGFWLAGLRNGNFQAEFSDGQRIYFNKDSDQVRISESEGAEFVYSLNSLMQVTNGQLWGRVAYLNGVVQQLQKEQFRVDARLLHHLF